MKISCDDMYPFGNSSTPSVEISSKEIGKYSVPSYKKPELDMNCLSSRKNG